MARVTKAAAPAADLAAAAVADPAAEILGLDEAPPAAFLVLCARPGMSRGGRQWPDAKELVPARRMTQPMLDALQADPAFTVMAADAAAGA